MPGSPFKCGGVAKSLPDVKVGRKVTIRIDDLDPTAKVYFRINGSDRPVTSANAHGYLNAGEAYEISGKAIKTAADIQLIDAANDPLIFFSLE